MRRPGLGGITLPLSALVMLMFCVSYVLGAQRVADSCLDCHTNVDQLKKITLDLEKKKPKKSAETVGEG
jgi:hypothetical protein